MADFDVCVIGGGPAGFAAAMRSHDFGKRVCLVERRRLGGTGVHQGALSSKTLWELSRDYQRTLRTDRGYRIERVELDYRALCRCVEDACSEKETQLELQLSALAPGARPPTGSGSITRLRGEARFLDAHTVLVADGGEPRRVTAEHFVIATGSRPRTLPDIAVDGQRILTSDHVMALEQFPRSLVVLGAGVVGCEFATIFANYGQTKVYLIDRAPRILPFEDEDVARTCERNLEQRGVTIHRSAKLLSMRVVEDQVEYELECGGERQRFRVDVALISVGRSPNTDTLGLAEIGVRLKPNGCVVNDDTRTSLDHIYAIGDVTDDIALVNVGEIEGRHAAKRIAGAANERLSYENLSTIMFLDPEVAAIGINELTARERKLPYRVAVYGYGLVNRAIAMRATDGFVKLLVSDDDELRILGMRALGPHASTMIEGASLLIRQGGSIRELAELLQPHPAITEGLQDCARMLLGNSMYKPDTFPKELRLARVVPE